MKELGEACVDALPVGRRVLSEGCASSSRKPVGQASSVQLTEMLESAAQEFLALQGSTAASYRTDRELKDVKLYESSNSIVDAAKL